LQYGLDIVNRGRSRRQRGHSTIGIEASRHGLHMPFALIFFTTPQTLHEATAVMRQPYSPGVTAQGGLIMFTAKFWADAAERTIKTFCQTLAGLLIGVDWLADASVPLERYLQAAVGAAVVALLMAVAATKIGASNTAAWLPEGPDTQLG
jgi:hypothetical protein